MTHYCQGCNTLSATSRAWHGAYCRWLDAKDAGRSARAAAWGFVADRIVRFS